MIEIFRRDFVKSLVLPLFLGKRAQAKVVPGETDVLVYNDVLIKDVRVASWHYVDETLDGPPVVKFAVVGKIYMPGIGGNTLSSKRDMARELLETPGREGVLKLKNFADMKFAKEKVLSPRLLFADEDKPEGLALLVFRVPAESGRWIVEKNGCRQIVADRGLNGILSLHFNAKVAQLA